MKIIWLLFVVGGVVVESLPHLQKAFKCAGDHGLICETGLCYDSLGFYENGQNVGCAQPEMCTKVGCFMYKNVFTCCCANRFCNGKTEMLMIAKYEMFKQNHGAWPTNLPPRIFARNISVTSPQLTQDHPSDVRLAPQRKPTTLASNSQAQQKTPIYEQQVKSIEVPEKTGKENEKKKEEKERNGPQHQQNIQSSTHSSTTTKMATLQSTHQKTPKPLIVEKEVKLTSSATQPQASAKNSGNSEEISEEILTDKDNERTTRSSQDGKVQPTTTRPRKQKEKKEKAKEGVKVETVKARKEEVHHPKAYPWYGITIVGFIIASILGVFVYLFIKKYRQRRATQREDSLRNASSVDSSRISDAYPNEHGRETADPLLSGRR